MTLKQQCKQIHEEFVSDLDSRIEAKVKEEFKTIMHTGICSRVQIEQALRRCILFGYTLNSNLK